MSRPLRAFGLLLASKILLMALPHLVVLDSPIAVARAIMAVTALVGIARAEAWGCGILVALFGLRVATTFPHTLNHAWFELLMAVILWRASARSGLRTSVQAHALLQVALLSVFFYSGVQKIVHGQFASGEYLLRTIAFESGPMADALRSGFGYWTPMPSAASNALTLGPIALEVTPQLHAGVLVLSVGIIAAELALPILVAARVRGARWALMLTQIGIGLVSGEVDFALTATGLVLLLWPRPPRSAWVGAFVGWFVVGVLLWS